MRKGQRPGLKIGMNLSGDRGGYRRVLPFRPAWLVIALVAAMDVVFIVPAVLAFQDAAAGWSNFDSLFDLVGAFFLSAWLIGWLLAPLVLTLVLIIMLFGREVLRTSPGRLDVFLGLPVLGITARYDLAKVRNLRIEKALPKSGHSWRGPHLVFDYGASTVRLGYDIGIGELAEIRRGIERAGGISIRDGEARAEEPAPQREPDEDVLSAPLTAKAACDDPPATLASPSTLALIIANLIPLAGAVFLGWKLSDVMVLYWAESAIIGFFNICKIVVIGRWLALLAAPFFLGHFGGFMSIHFLFIYLFFVKGVSAGSVSGGDLAEVGQLFVNLWPALLALFVSHAYSFFHNFIGRQEYRGRTVKMQMSEPYSRIIFMHLVLIFGGGLSILLGQPTPVLIIVIGLKIYFDVKAHLKQRTRS